MMGISRMVARSLSLSLAVNVVTMRIKQNDRSKVVYELQNIKLI